MKELYTYLLTKLPEEDGYYVYLLLCENKSLYCGWTTNIKKRYEKHKNGMGAKYTRMHKPLGVFYLETLDNAQEARKREFFIKKMSRKEKIALRML